MTLPKYDQLVAAVRSCNISKADRLHSEGIRLSQKTRNALLLSAINCFNPITALWLFNHRARLSQDVMEEIGAEAIQRDKVAIADFLTKELGFTFPQDRKDDLLAELIHPLRPGAVRFLERQGAKLSQNVKDKKLEEVVKDPIYVDYVSCWLDKQGATVSHDMKDELLAEMIKRPLFSISDWLEERGVRLSGEMKVELFLETIRRPYFGVGAWLMERGARLSQNAMDELLAEMYTRPNLYIANWLEDQGAKVRAPNELLERLCLLTEPNEYVVAWIRTFQREDHTSCSTESLRLIFSTRAHSAARLLSAKAKIRSNLMLLLLFANHYGHEDPRVIQQGELCTTDELASLLATGKRDLPSIVFQRLSEKRIGILSKDGAVYQASKDLLRLRSKAASGFMRLRDAAGQSGRPLDFSDVEDKLLKFLVHYLECPPSSVDWGQLSQKERSRFQEITNEYLIT